MIKRMFLLIMGVALFTGMVLAETETKLITMKDGTTVQGQITGMTNGDYVVTSPSLGEIKVKQNNVASITLPGQTPSGAAAGAGRSNASASASELQAVQAQIMSDPGMMQDIQALASDPDVIAIMSDPAFIRAAQAKDVNAIQSNPRTAQLMQNPKVRALIERLQATSGIGK